jgi:RNase P subunit RPR2
MIEVSGATAARIALARRMLGCPDCRNPLWPWGHARERTIRDAGGALLTVRPDRALCTGWVSPTWCWMRACCRAAPTRPG